MSSRIYVETRRYASSECCHRATEPQRDSIYFFHPPCLCGSVANSKLALLEDSGDECRDRVPGAVGAEGNGPLIRSKKRASSMTHQADQHLRRGMPEGVVVAGRYYGPARADPVEEGIPGCGLAAVMRHLEDPGLQLPRAQGNLGFPGDFKIAR